MYLIDCCLRISVSLAEVHVARQALTSSNQSWEGEMNEAKPMIVPKLVVFTKADWRVPANTRQSHSIHPSSLPKGRSMDEAPKSYRERQKEARAAGWSFSFGGRACLSLSRH
jgi:hypothetical protein